MEFGIKTVQAAKQRTACLVVALFEARKLSTIASSIDEASNGYLSNLLRKGDIEGRYGQLLILHSVPGIAADRLLLVGCGKERELTETSYLELIQKVVNFLNESGAMEAVCCLTEEMLQNKAPYWRLRLALQASYAALYRFDQLKTKKNSTRKPVRKLIFTVSKKIEISSAEQAIKEGCAIGEASYFLKNLANLPPNLCTPTYLADQATKLAKRSEKLSVAILEKDQIQALNMHTFLAVAKGSDEAPKLITLEYQGTRKDQKPIVLVGKGITFDSGGNSMKSAANMIGMKYDMCGAATVLAVLQAASQLALPLNIVGVIPSCENMVSGRATRPDDVVTSMSGTTVEIINTDAEGRLILCDALHYCERYNPEVVIDIATLTGACIVALGRHATGLFSNHEPLAQELLQAGLLTHDKAWQLPLWEEYNEHLKSPVADLANVGGPEGGSVVAACFLAHFTKKFHWAHLDVAGTATQTSGKDKGATGRPLGLLMQYLLNCTQRPKKSRAE